MGNSALGLTVLLVGANSTLGVPLARTLAERGHRVLTTDRCEKAGPSNYRLDLADPPESWPQFSDAIDVVFLAAAITDQRACDADPDKARLVNVTNTLELIRRLRDQGYRVVFPSTNLVLPCRVPSQGAETTREPIGFYGRMKAEVEAEMEHDFGVAICRLAKVLSADLPLLRNWIEALKTGIPIRALTDLVISPVSLAYAVDMLCRIIEQGEGGIWQLSGEKEISYCALAKNLASILDAPAELVICKDSSDAGLDLPSRPAHPSLNTERLVQTFGVRPQSLSSVLADITRRSYS